MALSNARLAAVNGEVAMLETQVLVVGAGPVGLTASVALSQSGIEHVLVERHPSTSSLPKARAINARTMEMYRQMGLENDIRAAGLPPKFGGMILWAESLAGKEINRLAPGRGSAASLAASPVGNCGCSQDILEPILRAHAERFASGSVRFNAELSDLQHGTGGATGVLTDRVSGRTTPFRARYVIGADGTRSFVREKLGIGRTGERDIYDSVNVHVRADLRPWVEDRPAALYLIEQPEFRATFLTVNGADRWGFLVHSLSAYGFTKENLTVERCVDLVRRAVGVPDLPVEVLGINFWNCSAMVADRFGDGNVFLAGDAAHETTPSGGFGMNLGVQDVQNLAWKLAAVLRGEATPSLLDTYEAERRPHALDVVRATLLNMQSFDRSRRQAEAKLPRKEFLNERGLVFGACYQSAAIVTDGSKPPEVKDPVIEYVPSAHPGCRAPHVWLQRADERISTIDLFGRGFVLLAAPGGSAWRSAADRQRGTKIDVHVLGEDVFDPEGLWMKTYGVGEGGAVLVRPDGYVGWRVATGPGDPGAALGAVLGQILGRDALKQAV
ncbi:FAD-dependent monooxygenase [Bradyrhizobium liaoningense]|uniref:FAD-dependent monooxygenase n=1 Tax=Bradyrhizobium liaoningense TaxID=43992 RepID=UPI001BAC4C0A|nr:FAD-dependent monooxygenase [Bradyrhizobium liaoningense]MBR0858048.1 FAD-dependent monooxygenase [Bradyrhizobium liaoningense]